jgi:uncharacterized protein YjbI with pentapeptide repeats
VRKTRALFRYVKELDVSLLRSTISGLLGGAFVVLLALLGLWAIKTIPRWQVNDVTSLGLRNDDVRQFELENEARKTLSQIVLGAFGLIALFLTWRRVQAGDRNVRVIEQGHITDRYTKAIEQLGKLDGDKPNIEVRLGAIYALERIAFDSRRDHWTIMEVLTAYVRQNAPAFPSIADDEPRTDIQAILTVLGRRKRGNKRETARQTLNLNRTDLKGVDLSEAHFEGADLIGANLQGAYLCGAHLEQANFGGTHLEMARLEGANLQRTKFRGAYLEKADLSDAHLEGADLEGAHLEGARLFETHLEGSNLTEAHLQEAKLIGTYFQGAYLTLCHLERAELIGSHLEGANLQGAYLMGAHLEGAYVERANFEGANVEGASITGIHLGLTNPVGPLADLVRKQQDSFRPQVDPSEL